MSKLEATYSNGRHTRGGGFQRDREKMNAAQLAGWIVLEFTAAHVQSGYALLTIEKALCEALKKPRKRE